MKIVQINSVYNYGSTGRITQNIHANLLKRGYQSYVFYGRGPKSKDENVYKIGNWIEFGISIMLTRLFNRHAEGNYFATLKLINKLKKIKPDIIHLHNIHGYYINYSMLFEYLEKSGQTVVWLMHDRWAISGSSAFFDSTLLDWENPKGNQIREISKYYPKYIYVSDKSALRNYLNKKRKFRLKNLHIVSPSKWQAEILKESYFSETEICVINNGINLDAFKPLVIEENREKKTIIGVANKWDDNKGLSVFNQLANDLDSSYQLILVGTDKTVLNSINPKVKCINRTETIEELVELYSIADVLVNPTMDDNFPTVNIESQACGTPVITYNTGGSGESITVETGVVVEKGNYEALLAAIIQWPRKNLSIIEACQKNAYKYSEINMVKSYLQLYRDIKH